MNYFNQDDGQNFGGDMNFDDPQFQMNNVENRQSSMIVEEIKQSNDLMNPETTKRQDYGGDKFTFQPWISQNVEKQLELVITEERDLVDQVDLYYPFDPYPQPVINLANPEESKNEDIPSHQIVDKAEEKQNIAI